MSPDKGATRRKGREAAVQLLCALDVQGFPPEAAPRDDFWKIRSTAEPARLFAEEMVKALLASRSHIDETLQSLLKNYRLPRLALVDRNILRLALHEILHCPDVPPIVAIDEAIEVAKKFGTPESGRFVNGVLDRAKDLARRPLRTPQNSG